ncbi:MAG: peptidoglycan DD-metalloendopeptidase family protein [Sandaracinaceae bacterium]|nr:peptidoglycan DD-metalloendopeptidase family protein [Sandaracinaceae bacterium]
MSAATKNAIRFAALVSAAIGLGAIGGGVGRAHAQFSYAPAGDLEDATRGRDGYTDAAIWVTGMTFPLAGNAYANSQVFRPGGGWYHGPLSGECHASNYQYPWFDNYCESRDNDAAHRPLLCALGYGHAGQDIRPATCADRTHEIRSATDGMVTAIGSYSVTVTDAMGRRFQYLHMRRPDVMVRVGDPVHPGTALARVSNNPGTSIHLHFQMRWSVRGSTVWVPPYSSLVAAYGAGSSYPSATAPRLRSPVESPNATAFFCHGDWGHHRTDHQCRTVTRPQFGTTFTTEANAPVYAAADGTVLRTVDGTADGSRTGGGLGNQLVVLHAGGRATLYGHLRSGLPRRQGDMVRCGDVIGYTQGTELYFEVKDGVTDAASYGTQPPIDPYSGECSRSDSLWAGDAPSASCERREGDDSQLVSATYPREVTADPGQSLVQTWTVRNNGTTTWSSDGGYALVYDSGEGFGAPMRVDLPVGAMIAPGQTQVFTLPATVPSAPGRYTGRWRMTHGMTKFGQSESLSAVVTSVPSGGRSCRSATLGTDVASGECVQVYYGACGQAHCSFYRCNNGAWQCTGESSCSMRHGNEQCAPRPADPVPDMPRCDGLGCEDCVAREGCGFCGDSGQCVSLSGGGYGGLTQGSFEIPRVGVENGTLRSWAARYGRAGDETERYGTTTTAFGNQYVRGTISHFGGASDTGVSSTETGSISGERLRSLNNPPNPTATQAATNPDRYYYVAMRFAFPADASGDPNPRAWRDRRVVLVNPTTGARVVVRPVDWGPNPRTGRTVDASPQALRDLGLSTDQEVLVAFAPEGTPLGVQPSLGPGGAPGMCTSTPHRDASMCPPAMCTMQFRGCETHAECCDASTNPDVQCFAGICDNQAQCHVWGEACETGGRTSPNRCCGNMQCATQAAGLQCCVSAGGVCRSESDCCGDMACTAGECVPVADGARCWSSFECGGSSTCNAGRCGRPT